MINDILGNLFSIEVRKIFPRESTRFAKDYFKGKKIKAIEIGVLLGDNSRSILNNLNVEKIYLIDPYCAYLQDTMQDWSKDKELAKVNLNVFGDKIVWIYKLSSEAYKEIKEKVDFIYIDGNHTYKYIKEDLENYFPLLNKGGVISGHDIQYNDITNAVIEFCNKNNLKLNIGDRRDWWIIK